MLPRTDERQRVITLLKRYGWNATSFQVLEEGFRYWWDGADACVAYRDTGGAWVAAGAPIAPEAALTTVARRFVAEARRARRRSCFFASETRFAGEAPFRRVPIGEQPIWDPMEWAENVRSSRSLREQLRRGRAKGVAVRRPAAAEIGEPTSPVRRSLDALIARWLGSRSMPPMGFLVGVEPFSFAQERLLFVAERHGQVVGLLAAAPIYARGGWLFDDLIRDPEAPNGTTDLLVDAAMRAAAAGHSRHVTLGLVPLAGAVSGWLAMARVAASALYDFRGLRAFRARLRPKRWDPLHLTFVDEPPTSVVRHGLALALFDTLAAFAGGSLTGFGLATLLRRGGVTAGAA